MYIMVDSTFQIFLRTFKSVKLMKLVNTYMYKSDGADGLAMALWWTTLDMPEV